MEKLNKPITQKIRETRIESRVCDYAKSNGWLVYKLPATYQKGLPDRIFLKNGYCFFIEFKAPGGSNSEIQKRVHTLLSEQNFEVYVVDNVEEGKGIIDGITKTANERLSD